MKTELDHLTHKKAEAEDESKRIRQLAGRASKELQQNKQLVEKQKRMIAELTEEKDNMTKLYKGNKQKDLEELRSKLAHLEKERNNGKKLLSGANEMNEKLRERLRQFQKVINECKKNEALLHSQLEQARTEAKDTDEANVDAQPAISAPASMDAINAGERDKTEKPETKDTTDSAANTRATKAIRNVPLGGFVFGPSEPARSLQGETIDDDTIQKNSVSADNDAVVNDVVTDENNSKDSFQGSTQLLSDENKTSQKVESTENPSTISRRFSGERKELSIKEKLMERKRKLMIDMQIKQEVLRKTQDVAQTATDKDEPAAKRNKVAAAEDHGSEIVVIPKAIDDPRTSGIGSTSNSTDEAPKQSLSTEPGIASSPTDRGSMAPTTAQGLLKAKNPPDPGAPLALSGLSLPAQPGNPPSPDSEKKMISSSAFLNIKPPGVSSSTPKFQFGSSNAIKLPTPSMPQQSNIFNAFSTATTFNNGRVTTKPLFTTGSQNDDDNKAGTDEMAGVDSDEQVEQKQDT